MIYLYDRAICNDLQSSFDSSGQVVVKVIDPENVIGLAAQIRDDAIKLPIVALERDDSQIDTRLSNFTRKHIGVPTVLDNVSNNIYNEKAMPISLSYKLHVLTANTVDMDELIRELIFKYSDMYFLNIEVPYESNRNIRFGIQLIESNIERVSGASEYISSGKIYESVLSLVCEGCVLLTYTPHKLIRTTFDVEPDIE